MESTTRSTVTSQSSGARLKVTVWRLLNTALMMGFGIYKSYYTTLGSPTSDWIICIGWAVIAYWGMYVEVEAPMLAPWLFIRDFSRPTWFVLAEASTMASIIGAPVFACLWVFPNSDKPADRAVSTFLWILSVASALYAPIQFWDQMSNSRIITWIRRRWMPRQFNDSDLAGMFILSKWVAGLGNVGQIVYNLYHFTRSSNPAPSFMFLWLLTTGISFAFPLVICEVYLAVHQRS